MKITEKKVRNEISTEFKFDNGAWACVYIDTEDSEGSWEYQSDENDEKTYSEGSLCFDGNELVDYYGCYELPEEVTLAISDMGYEIEED